MKVVNETADVKASSKDNYVAKKKHYNSITQARFSPNSKGLKMRVAPSFDIFNKRSLGTHNTSTLTGIDSSGIDGGPSLNIANVSNSIISKSPIRKSFPGMVHHNDMNINILSDELLQQSTNIPMISKQKQLTQYLSQEASKLLTMQQKVLAGGSMRKFKNTSQLRASHNNENESIRLSKTDIQPTHMLADYHSVAVLPLIGNEINLERKRERQFSKVELSKKDMQNFLVNGSISKEFILTNKKELQKFIRQQQRSESQGNFMKGYNEINTMPQFNTQVSTRKDMFDKPDDLMRKKNSATFGKTQLVGAKPSSMSPVRKEQLVHQQPDKDFHGETSQVNKRVLETWINETLADAQHLDIPGIIVKPENKNPIHRYGIDRLTMTNAGLESDEVDRIYRCLFVYSVGFFEMLKKVLSQSENNFSIITQIWKVFQVLLEYSCKTDYKIMMATISENYQENLEKLHQENLKNIQKYKDNERVLKQNIDVMQNYQDQLEKDKQNEKSLRLKLEEEYMQNTQNHEEEVKLRLRFESKLNGLYADHRQLAINYDRIQTQLITAQEHNSKLEVLNKIIRDELVEERRQFTDSEFRFKAVLEQKENILADVTLKNARLKLLEKEQKKAKEQNEFANFNISDKQVDLISARKEIQQLKMEITTLKSELKRLGLFNQNFSTSKYEIDDLYNNLKTQFETTEALKSKLFEENQSLVSKTNEQKEMIDAFRSTSQYQKERIQELETLNAQLENDHQTSKKYSNFAKTDIEATALQLQRMNDERHKIIKLLEVKTAQCIDLQNTLVARDALIVEHESTILSKAHFITHLQGEVATLQETLYKKNLIFTEQIDEKSKQIQEIIKFSKNQTEEMQSAYFKITKLEKQITKQKADLNELFEQNTNLKEKCQGLKFAGEQAVTKIKELEGMVEEANILKQGAIVDKQNAEQLAQVYQEQVRNQQKMMKDYKDMYDKQLEEIHKNFEVEFERATMRIEDNFSCGVRLQEIIDRINPQMFILLKRAERKEELEILIKECGARLQQSSEQIEAKDRQITTMKNEYATTLYEKEQQFKKLTKERNLEVNSLEIKLTEDSILYQKKLKEASQLEKEVRDLKFAIKQAHKASPNKQSQQHAMKHSDQVNKATQTRANKRASQERSPTNILNETIKSNKSGANSSKSGFNKKFISGYKLPNNIEDTPGRGGDSSVQIRLIDEEEDYGPDGEGIYSEDEQHEQDQSDEASKAVSFVKKTKDTKFMFAQFKQWLLQNEYKLLKKVQFMILNDIEVTPEILTELRSKFLIPYDLRTLVLTDDQNEEIVQLQKDQTDQFQKQLISNLNEDKIDDDPIMTQQIQKEVEEIKKKYYPHQSTEQKPLLSQSQDIAQSSVERKSEVKSFKAQSSMLDSIFNHDKRFQTGGPLTANSFYNNVEAKMGVNTENLSAVSGENFINKETYVNQQIEIGTVGVGQGNSKPKNESLENRVENLDKKSEEDKIKLVEEKKKIREKFFQKMSDAYSKFGTNNKTILDKLFEEQKDRLAFRAKQQAKMHKPEQVKIINKKVGIHYLIEQKKEEDKRIKHIQSFLGELVKQKLALANKEGDETVKTAQLEEQRIQTEINEAQKRLERMKKTVIIREDLIKQELAKKEQEEIYSRKAKQEAELTRKAGESANELNNHLIIKSEPQLELTTPNEQSLLLDLARMDQISREEGHQDQDGSQSKQQRSIVFTNMNLTEEADRDEGTTSNEDALTNAIFKSKMKVDATESKIAGGLNFDQKGGVAHVNRQALVRKKSSELLYQSKLKEAREVSEEKKAQKPLGVSTIRTLIKSVDSRKNN